MSKKIINLLLVVTLALTFSLSSCIIYPLDSGTTTTVGDSVQGQGLTVQIAQYSFDLQPRQIQFINKISSEKDIVSLKYYIPVDDMNPVAPEESVWASKESILLSNIPYGDEGSVCEFSGWTAGYVWLKLEDEDDNYVIFSVYYDAADDSENKSWMVVIYDDKSL